MRSLFESRRRVPSSLKILYNTAHAFSRIQPDLPAMYRKPSEQLKDQEVVYPLTLENVGKLIDHSNADLNISTSDYPHSESGRGPFGSFEEYLADHITETRQ